MSSPETDIIGTFDIPYISGITDSVMKALEAKRNGEKIYIDIDKKILYRMRNMESFSMKNYIITRSQEQIASKIFEIITNEEYSLTLTDISTDIIRGYDMKMRIQGINHKYHPLEAVDITLNYERYLYKKNHDKTKRNNIHTLYLPGVMVDSVYKALIENILIDAPIEKRILHAIEKYLEAHENGYNPQISYYNQKEKVERRYNIRELFSVDASA